MTRITRGGLMVVAAAMTVTVSACGHVWDSESTGQTTSGARTTPSVLSPTPVVTDVATAAGEQGCRGGTRGTAID